jgi:hypothetical protein
MDDGTPIVWDTSALDNPVPATEMTADQLSNLWDGLLSEDAARGREAMSLLAANPHAAIPFLKERVKPFAVPSDGALESSLRDLDNDQWSRRNQAEKVLLRLGKQIEPRLREELRRPLRSLELRRRLERILARFEERVASPELPA